MNPTALGENDFAPFSYSFSGGHRLWVVTRGYPHPIHNMATVSVCTEADARE